MNFAPFIASRSALLTAAGLQLCAVAPAHAQLPSQLYAEATQAYQAGDIDGAKRKLQLTLQINKDFRPASELLNQINLAQQQARTTGPAGAVPVPTKVLAQTVFPVEFKDTSLPAALEYIRQQTEEKTGGRAQINFVLQLPPELASKQLTLRLNHVPVPDMLHYIGDLAGVKFQTQQYAIVVVPAGDAPGDATVAATPAHP